MRINSDYKLREMAGEFIIISQGKPGERKTHVISLNTSARLLYERLWNKEFTLQDAAGVLVEVYGVGKEQALQDAAAWIEKMMQCGVVDNE